MYIYIYIAFKKLNFALIVVYCEINTTTLEQENPLWQQKKNRKFEMKLNTSGYKKNIPKEHERNQSIFKTEV